MDEQDRSAWDQAAIEHGRALVLDAIRAAGPGRYVLQAAIAALHAEARTYADTDWTQIVTLYTALLDAWPSPVVALNRAVAVSMVDGPLAGLREIEALERDGRLAGYRYLPAARADILRPLARYAEAARSYRAAADLTDNAAERAYMAGRAEECCRG